ncbi:CDP-4-dehydro-6-deoxy-D-gulose 4-reductase [Spirochaetia bacterium]|nr:CDP-4-dehydro-6-deoxy-D-gulose 4-reductase [Spirochaetia bacterium]
MDMRQSEMRTVLITGATGLIGKEAIKPLVEAGFKVFALSSHNNINVNNAVESDITFVGADILNYDDIKKVFLQIKPEYLLHFAWITNAGYLTSELNYKLRDASIFMLKTFKENGGKRAVFAGTCFEYDFNGNAEHSHSVNEHKLNENDKLNPATIYAQCKNELHNMADEYAKQNDLSFGWGRIFYVFGHNEHPNRLLPTIINNLKNNKKVLITAGPLVRDYMYTKDIAAGFVKFLDSDVTGTVNICLGRGITIKEFTLAVANKTGNSELVEFADDVKGQPPFIVGDVNRLSSEVKFYPKYNLNDSLDEIISQL